MFRLTLRCLFGFKNIFFDVFFNADILQLFIWISIGHWEEFMDLLEKIIWFEFFLYFTFILCILAA